KKSVYPVRVTPLPNFGRCILSHDTYDELDVEAARLRGFTIQFGQARSPDELVLMNQDPHMLGGQMMVKGSRQCLVDQQDRHDGKRHLNYTNKGLERLVLRAKYSDQSRWGQVRLSNCRWASTLQGRRRQSHHQIRHRQRENKKAKMIPLQALSKQRKKQAIPNSLLHSNREVELQHQEKAKHDAEKKLVKGLAKKHRLSDEAVVTVPPSSEKDMVAPTDKEAKPTRKRKGSVPLTDDDSTVSKADKKKKQKKVRFVQLELDEDGDDENDEDEQEKGDEEDEKMKSAELEEKLAVKDKSVPVEVQARDKNLDPDTFEVEDQDLEDKLDHAETKAAEADERETYEDDAKLHSWLADEDTSHGKQGGGGAEPEEAHDGEHVAQDHESALQVQHTVTSDKKTTAMAKTDKEIAADEEKEKMLSHDSWDIAQEVNHYRPILAPQVTIDHLTNEKTPQPIVGFSVQSELGAAAREARKSHPHTYALSHAKILRDTLQGVPDSSFKKEVSIRVARLKKNLTSLHTLFDKTVFDHTARTPGIKF